MNYNQLQYHQQTGLLQTEDERQAGLFLHLSALANMIIPFAGYVLPIVIWQTKKDAMPAIVAHGKEAVNWMITSFIYSLITIVLMVIGFVIVFALEIPIIGFFILAISILAMFGLSITSIVYAVMAGVKANNGEHWKYPFNISFLK
jgi:uncharacterized Tic20 family protein